MHFNSAVRHPRPLGGLSKPGAGQVMVPMSLAPEGEIPLRADLVVSAQNAAYTVLGGPDFIINPGMIHEYNLLGQNPGFVYGSYNFPAWEGMRANLLASIAELIRSGWGWLTDFLLDAQSALSIAVQDAIEAQTIGGKRLAREIVQYVLDQLTALAPQVRAVAVQLDTGGQMVEDKIRGFKSSYEAATLSLEALLNSAGELIAALAEQAKEIGKDLKTPLKWGTVAIVGIAVVALVGGAIYFIPRRRR